MAPKRKKTSSDGNPPAESHPGNQSLQHTLPSDGHSASVDVAGQHGPEALPTSARQHGSQPATSPPSKAPTSPADRSSWYGSWRTASKSSPVTAQPTNESISVQQGTTSESLEAASSKRPALPLSKGMRSSRKSIPAVAEPTRVHATSDASDISRRPIQEDEKLLRAEAVGAVPEKCEKGKEPENHTAQPPLPLEPAQPAFTAVVTEDSADSKSLASLETNKAAQGGGWFAWWSRPDGYAGEDERVKAEDRRKEADIAQEASNTPLPGTPEEQPSQADLQPPDGHLLKPTEPAANESKLNNAEKPEGAAYNGTYRSWFGIWSSSQRQQAEQTAVATNKEDTQETIEDHPVDGKSAAVDKTPRALEDPAPGQTVQAVPKPPEGDVERPKSSGWAFWSNDTKSNAETKSGDLHKQVGELAVADTPSQSHPEVAQFNERRREEKQPELDMNKANTLLTPNKGKQRKSIMARSTAASQQPTPTVSQIPSPSGPSTPQTEESGKAVQTKKRVQIPPNLILPTFQDTYPLSPNPGYAERLNNLFWYTLGLQTPSQQPRHIYRLQHPPRIRKAIAIGVHGFFPAALIQKVLGQPTGTSIRFANYAASAIQTWCAEKQPDVKEIDIQKVALEGEGLVSDRVTTLWKLLLNWLSHLRQADFILLACHSQGVPVTVMLLAKLIQLGCLGSNVRIGVCAMAGINMGPFPEYKSRLFGGTALELFDFGDSSSKVSHSYASALDVCLRHGVRITYVGSLDDQVVSLESSLFTSLTHPYVSRAVFVDGRLHTSNFLTHLVVFALKLRNLGINDHGLIHELSAPLAGNLVGGEGHSRVYDDAAVYRLAIEFALESSNFAPYSSTSGSNPLSPADKAKADKSAAFARRSSAAGLPASMAAANSMRRGSFSVSTNLPGTAPIITPYEAPASSTSANPYYLPWAVRGMLEEELVKRDMQAEVEVLVSEFEAWKPTTKGLKDVKWRLEGVKSML